VDVLDVDDRVVDEFADGDGQAAQRHDVERHAKAVHGEQRNRERERERGQRDDRGPHIEEEEDEDDGDDDRCIRRTLNDVV
jgi:hypothetical protein